MKRMISVLLACLLVLGLCACGASETTAPAEKPAAAPSGEAAPEPAETQAAEPAANPFPRETMTMLPEETPPAPEVPETPDAPAFEPDFSFTTTDRNGESVDETIFAEAALTMVNFWEPWCGPCVREMPDIQKLSEDYADRGFRVIGVYSTPGMEDDVDAVLEQTGVTYPILHYCEAFDAFQTGYVPTTIFVDGQGHVLTDEPIVGSRSYDDWAALVEELLP